MSSDDSKLVPASAIPDVPDWVNNPESTINRYITKYLLGLIAGAVMYVTNTIDAMFGIFEDSIVQAGEPVLTSINDLGESFAMVWDQLAQTVVSVAQLAGPFAPIVMAVFVVAFIALSWRIIEAAMDSVPILSSIQTFLK